MGRLGNFLKIRGRGKAKKKHLLVLDIGTEFVKALILKLEEKVSDDKEVKQQGIIIGVGRQRQMPDHMLAGAVTDIEGVSLTCQAAINQAIRQVRAKPSRAVIGISGEFIKGASTNFVYQRENPAEAIGLAELQNIIQKIQWRAFDRMRRQLAYETCRSEIEIKPINALLTEIKIDSYQVTNPLGFQGKEIFLSIFTVYAPLVHLRAIEAIAAQLNLELLSIVAEPYALTRTSCFNPTAGAIFIDIGGGTTDIALIRQNKVEGIKSFGLAGQTFTRRLGKMFELDLVEAERIKMRYAHKRLSQNVQRKIRGVLKNDLGIWLNGVELVLEEFNQAEYFPPQIFLCGGGSLLPEIKSILKKEEIRQHWLGKFPFSQAPQVNFIQSKQINNIVDQTNSLGGPEFITPMALASLSLEIVGNEKKVLPPVLRRVMRIMR
ncbi:MAG: cell division FtsA domain-containing protein [Patescibacteria group bacterium]